MTSAAQDRISVRVLFFATYADLLGQHEVTATLAAGARVSDLVAWVRQSFAGGSTLPARPLVAVNRQHSRLDQLLADGDEAALLPPMAGG